MKPQVLVLCSIVVSILFCNCIIETNAGFLDYVKHTERFACWLFKSHDVASEIEPSLVFISNIPANQRETRNELKDKSKSSGANPVMKELRRNATKLSLEELEKYGFNKTAPVIFLIHGFTSGYLFQPWMSGIIEAHTIDESKNRVFQTGPNSGDQKLAPVSRNVIVVDWHYGARGSQIKYARAVGNMQIIADYVAKFMNQVLLEQAKIDPMNIQFVGHSLGAHLSGFIARRATTKIGRIIGLDPAGPCLREGDLRLNKSNAYQVATFHTNTALLGNKDSLGHVSVYLEEGKAQPDCRDEDFSFWSIVQLDFKKFDKVSCSHSRAPQVHSYQLTTSIQDDCELIGYECDSWLNFTKGHCGVCGGKKIDTTFLTPESTPSSTMTKHRKPSDPVSCARFGLDWQYNRGYQGKASPTNSSKVTPEVESFEAAPANEEFNENCFDTTGSKIVSTIFSSIHQWSSPGHETDEGGKVMYMKSLNMQPYCAYHYQVILDLSEKLSDEYTMQLLIQDATKSNKTLGGQARNSIVANELHKFDDLTYTALTTSAKKMFEAKHATLFADEMTEGDSKKIKQITVNYMSNIRKSVRELRSRTLCLKPTELDETDYNSGLNGRRFYFEPCKKQE